MVQTLKLQTYLGANVERMVYPIFRFVELIEPDDEGRGWRAKVEPANEFIDNYEFKYLVIAAGKKVPLEGEKKNSYIMSEFPRW